MKTALFQEALPFKLFLIRLLQVGYNLSRKSLYGIDVAGES